MNKVEQVINEINKLDRYKGNIVFYMMGKYGFIFGKDIERLKKLENIELEYEEGTLQGIQALRYKVFDPNNIQPFNSILLADGKPISVNVKPEYNVEKEFILN